MIFEVLLGVAVWSCLCWMVFCSLVAVAFDGSEASVAAVESLVDSVSEGWWMTEETRDRLRGKAERVGGKAK